MNQAAIGQYMMQKRKQRDLTQAQLAQKLGVSNKTISKWENGKCMPDYSSIEGLYRELEISISELIEGKDRDPDAGGDQNAQIMSLLSRTQELETQKKILYGILLLVMGIALLAWSQNFWGSPFRNFISGVLLGIAVGGMLVGVFCIGRCLRKK